VIDVEWITAIHEAGHAVAAIRAGLVFDQVSIVPDESLDADGALYWNEMEELGELVMPPELVAVVLLAGPCAEARARGLRSDRMFEGEAATQDREAMATLSLPESQFMAASREAQALIERDWNLIESVAAELTELERLDYEEVDAMVEAAGASGG
jgi:ATP-dependent Zn protease